MTFGGDITMMLTALVWIVLSVVFCVLWVVFHGRWRP